PELKSVGIDSPAGIIAIFSTFYGMKRFEHDWYKGGVTTSSPFFIYDYVAKRFIETGEGEGDLLTVLIQGQSEEEVLEYLPYSNSTGARFLRNGSWASNEPGGVVGPSSYLYPESWPAPCVTPEVDASSIWVAVNGKDIVKDSIYYASMYNELSKIGYLSDNSGLGGRTLFATQTIDPVAPASSIFFMPSTAGVIAISPVAGFKIPHVGAEDKSVAELISYREDGIYNFENLLLSTILPPEDDPPDTHTGSLMPLALRNILLSDPDISA
ncbi:unnamed protein product, partial [marine sediment metagenome]